MINLKEYVGKTVTIECTDGDIYENYYVVCFTSAYDNYEPYEDSIDIQKGKKYNGGIILYTSDIKNIKIIE